MVSLKMQWNELGGEKGKPLRRAEDVVADEKEKKGIICSMKVFVRLAQKRVSQFGLTRLSVRVHEPENLAPTSSRANRLYQRPATVWRPY